mmetsp:Transcript_17161/g.33638  ORF Transcript_17161/g.33638 Transcript_17161/m.33638 type:complete len:323 (+) Transcript_17161:153-1121(+)
MFPSLVSRKPASATLNMAQLMLNSRGDLRLTLRLRPLSSLSSSAHASAETQKTTNEGHEEHGHDHQPLSHKPKGKHGKGSGAAKSVDPDNFVQVFENSQATHIRLMAAFSVSQAAYWSALTADAYFAPALGLASSFTPSPEMLAEIPDAMGFYTNPGWILFGGLTSIVCTVLTRFYAQANISRAAIKDSSNEVEIRAHTFFGNVSPPTVYPIRSIEVTPPANNQRYFLVKVPERSWNLLMDSKGTFSNFYTYQAETTNVDPEAAAEERRRTVMARLGLTYGGFIPGAIANTNTESDPNLNPSSEPPTLEQIRAARLKRQGRK